MLLKRLSLFWLLFVLSVYGLAQHEDKKAVKKQSQKIDKNSKKYESCQAKWQRWVEKYAAHSPIASHNKTTKTPLHKFTSRNVQAVLDGKRKVEIGKKEEKHFPILLSEHMREQYWRVEAHKAGKKNSEFKTFLKNFRNYLDYKVDSISKDPHTLLIMNIGTAHAIDYFLHRPNVSVLYATPTMSEKSTMFGKDYLKFKEFEDKLNALGGNKRPIPKLKPKTPGSISHNILQTFYTMLTERLEQKHFYNLGELFPKNVTKSNIVVFGHPHSLNETAFIKEFLDKECLRVLGFKRVIWLGEGLDHKRGGLKNSDFSDFDPLYTVYLHKPKSEKEKKALKEMLSTDLAKFPILRDFIRKTKAYESGAGALPVKYNSFYNISEDLNSLLEDRWQKRKELEAFMSPLKSNTSALFGKNYREKLSRLNRQLEALDKKIELLD